MTSEPVLLGLDVGSTLIKAVVVDPAGRELAIGESSTPWKSCATGAETDPLAVYEQVLVSARAALDQLAERRDGAEPGPVTAVGVSSFAESLVLIDGAGEPVAPLVAWYDGRGEQQAASLERELGADAVATRSGMPVSVMPGSVKLRWLRDNIPAAAGARRALSMAEWVAHRLGGEPAAELSLASRTGALDVTTVSWWDELLAWAGFDRSLFPEPVTAGTSLGRITNPPPGLAALRAAVLTVGGHDHLCAAAGAGVVAPSEMLDSCGTAEGYVRAVEPLSAPAVLAAVRQGLCVSRHVIPGHEALLGGRPFGLVLGAVRDLLGGIPPEVDEVASTRLELTYDDSGRASLSGIVPGVGPADAWAATAQAVLAVSFDVYAHLERFGGPVQEVVLTGGWSEVEPVLGAKLARFARCVRPLTRQAGGRGAALFGAVAAGLLAGPADFPKPAYEVLGRR